MKRRLLSLRLPHRGHGEGYKKCFRLNCYQSIRNGFSTTVSAPRAGTQELSDSLLCKIHIVDTVARAENAVGVLKSAKPTTMFACDTEVADINLKRQSPVGNGKVTCVSLFAGPGIDFGAGEHLLWIDCLDGEPGTLEVFKDFFESEGQWGAKKVWHNYGFDRHVMYNHGIDVRGLGADTMHMARLWNTARNSDGTSRKGYSLESLSSDLISLKKISMDSLFSKPVLKKDGTEGKKRELPPIEIIQRNDDTRDDWIKYSCRDAQSTLQVYNVLKRKLEQIDWKGSGTNMYQFYTEKMVPFGELLTDLEREGFQLRGSNYLQEIEHRAIQEREKYLEIFMKWVEQSGGFKYKTDAKRFNPASFPQRQRLLFGYNGKLDPDPARRKKLGKQREEAEKNLAIEVVDQIDKKLKALEPKETPFKVENIEGIIEEGKKKPLKNRDLYIKGLGLKPIKYSATGWPAVSADVISTLANDPEKAGGGEKGKAAAEGLKALHMASSVNTMLNTFILPLQEMADERGRIHCSLNLNTETGRLSSQKPNLQNQPALEKDVYKIRDAFVASEGNALIVADYGQLELRVLAHMSKCISMIEAFIKGGDFHSRTAMGMYPYIAEAEKKGEVLLEWDEEAEGKKAPVPLIKDVYASERRKAKVLNFSIAYGKTPQGLAKDWGVEVQEAKETVNRWYADRPEVLDWQRNTIKEAKKTGHVRTMWGRYRHIPGITSDDNSIKSHFERAAINTPIQGSAADVVMGAMLRIHKDSLLKQLGFKMILQVHDEVILEGPKKNAEVAMDQVVKLMKDPFAGVLPAPLLVDLTVDAKTAESWYKAK